MGRRSRHRRYRAEPTPPSRAATASPPVGGHVALAGLLTILVLIIGVYGRSVRFDFTRTDDTVLLVEDARFIGNLSSIPQTLTRPFFRDSSRGEGYYRPLVTSSFILDAQWNGTQPAAFHATNVVCHLVATWLLVFLLIELGFGRTLSLIAAAIFSVNPAIAEAVYWIPGRCDLLLGVGFLISSLCFLRYLRSKGMGPLFVHLIGLGIALLSKEAGVIIPAVAMGYVLIVERRPQALRDRRLWAGWGVVLLGWYALWSSAGSVAASEPFSHRLATVWSNIPVLLVHLGKTVVPYGLSVLANRRDAGLWVGSLVFLSGVGIVAWLSGGARRIFIWGALVFFLFLLPTLAVSDFLILENRLYVPAMAVLIACLAMVQAVLEHREPRARQTLLALGAAVIVAYALRTWHYGESFRDAASFTAQAVKSSPQLALAHLNRGIVLHRDGHMGEAEAEYRTAIYLDPQQPITQNNLGLIHLNRGDVGTAEALLRSEIAINPAYDKAHFNLGLALARDGRLHEAVTAWRQAVALNPENDEARSNLEAAQQVLATGQPP